MPPAEFEPVDFSRLWRFAGRALPEVTVLGTGPESADDWLTREATALADAGVEHWLVTSDRELRLRAGKRVARSIGGGAFLRELLEERAP